MVSVTGKFNSGAAAFVALFLWPLAWLAWTSSAGVVTPAVARVRAETLTVVTKAGGKSHTFDVEIAETEQEKALGLMFRTELPAGRGMLFPYKVSRTVSMWMRNTYIPLDMLFIRSDGSVARIEENAEPQSERVINSGGPVLAVLEIGGGESRRLGIAAGDKVEYPIFKGPDGGSW